MIQLDWISLGFPPPSKDTRVVVAMSGGVDSSVTASLLAEAGYDVIGITLQLYDHGMVVGKSKACCAGQDIYDASQVAEKMGFPHYVLDYESIFKQKVIDDFADSYLRGETPIPCIQCNQQVKFKDLLKTAKDLGGHCLVTGHYVQRHVGSEKAELHQAIDSTKDQSYFLFTTKQEELNYLRFPLGGLTKAETREHAQRFGLSVADKPDSQDICFVPDGDYAKVVQKLRPGASEPGNIVHMNGSILGRHPGIIHYTVGQRKGLGIGGSAESNGPLYVIRLDEKSKEVIVGEKEDLAQKRISVSHVNWLGASDTDVITCTVKIRSTQTPLKASVTIKQDKADVVLLEPEYGISPGQACVFYNDSRVLGGGWITK